MVPEASLFEAKMSSMPSRLVRKFDSINEIPSATTHKNFATTYMDFYFCLRKRGPEAMLLSRIYDRTMAYQSVIGFKGPKDPKNITPQERDKLSIMETMPRDGSALHGWVQFKDDYWTSHLPLTSDQISRALLFLSDIGIIELETSRGTEKAIKGIRLVRINANVYNRAVFECVRTTVAQRSSWGEGKGAYTKEKANTRYYDFWSWIKSERHVEVVPSAPIPKDAEKFPKHEPRPWNPRKIGGETENHGLTHKPITENHGLTHKPITENHGLTHKPITENHGYGGNTEPRITVTEKTAENGENGENGDFEAKPRITVSITENHGLPKPRNAVYQNRESRFTKTENHGDKEHRYEQTDEQIYEQEGGSAILQLRNSAQFIEDSCADIEGVPEVASTPEQQETSEAQDSKKLDEAVKASLAEIQKTSAARKFYTDSKEARNAIPDVLEFGDIGIQDRNMIVVANLGWNTYVTRKAFEEMMGDPELPEYMKPWERCVLSGMIPKPDTAKIAAMVKAAEDVTGKTFVEFLDDADVSGCDLVLGRTSKFTTAISTRTQEFKAAEKELAHRLDQELKASRHLTT